MTTTTTTPTYPELTGDYDADSEAGWVHHRNGVSGCPFWCRIDAKVLTVVFTWGSEDGAPIRVPLTTLVADATGFNSYPTRYGQTIEITSITLTKTDLASTGVVTFAWSSSVDDSPFLSVTDLGTDPDRHCTAVFSVEGLLTDDVRFGYNSWRGDHVHHALLEAFDLRTW